jgi:hypothetical protein
MVFLTFLKFSLKFREQILCREAASNALSGRISQVIPILLLLHRIKKILKNYLNFFKKKMKKNIETKNWEWVRPLPRTKLPIFIFIFLWPFEGGKCDDPFFLYIQTKLSQWHDD